MARILASRPFRSSERYPRLLRYVVEAALEGRADSLKERTLGIEVFGRPPEYDPSLDNVVRNTAGEVRRRLAQYYDDPIRHAELRITLPVGSYVPQFALPVEAARDAGSPALRARPTALDEFWAPVAASPGAVLIVVGPPPEDASERASIRSGFETVGGRPTLAERHKMPVHHIGLPDATTMMRIAASLQARGKDYRVKNEAVAGFEDFREGPAVLIGAFNNHWTRQLGQSLRFVFEGDLASPNPRIRDRWNPEHPGWSVDTSKPVEQADQDYGIVARVFSPAIGQTIVIAAGLCMYGTLAAGELLAKPDYLDELRSHAPANWPATDIEVVIATSVIDGVSGPPRIIATHLA
jgi:hypothetical protein